MRNRLDNDERYLHTEQTVPKMRLGITNFLTGVIYLILYWIFSTFTSHIYYYQSPYCRNLLDHAQTVSDLYYYLSIVSFIFLFVQCFSNSMTVITLKSLMYSAAMLIFFIYSVILTIDLFKGEPCGQLNTLVLAWVILNWVGYGCVFCILGFLVCFGAGMSAISRYTNRL